MNRADLVEVLAFASGSSKASAARALDVPGDGSVHQEYNFTLLKSRLPVPCWGRLPFRATPDPVGLAGLLEPA